MRFVGVAVLSVALLTGVFAAPLLHVHAAVEHEHGEQDPHHHESLLHAHVLDGRDSDADQHAGVGDHGHSDATAIIPACCLVRVNVSSAAPGMVADGLKAPHDPTCWSSLDLTPASHPRGALHLIGPSLRGPPA
jgi:hypothetical protein